MGDTLETNGEALDEFNPKQVVKEVVEERLRRLTEKDERMLALSKALGRYRALYDRMITRLEKRKQTNNERLKLLGPQLSRMAATVGAVRRSIQECQGMIWVYKRQRAQMLDFIEHQIAQRRKELLHGVYREMLLERRRWARQKQDKLLENASATPVSVAQPCSENSALNGI